MTLVKSRQSEVAIERERSSFLVLIRYFLPGFLLVLLVFAAYMLNVKASQISYELSQIRKNLSNIQQQNEVLDRQITKLFIGRDVIN